MNDENGWEKYGGYMAAKVIKLDNQFNEGQNLKVSDIFSGICIYINGFTDPSDYVIKKILQENGGKYCHYYSREKVTHIIANTLPKVKIEKLKDEKVVSPKWITDSVKAGKILNFADYELYTDRYKSDSKIMKQFLSGKIENSTSKPIIEEGTGSISINEFYQKSRLHHLSTWTSELKGYLETLKNQLTQSDSNVTLKAKVDFRQVVTEDATNILTYSKSLFMHIDMDCFFVSVGIRNHPELKGYPIAVSHSKTSNKNGQTNSMSEVASCSYEARKFGIKNGMLLGRAKNLCPDLVTIPYTFDEYLEVSKSLYKIVFGFTQNIEIGSCDELYIDLTDIIKLDSTHIINPIIFANHIRELIFSSTGGCSASCGIGSNMLISKIATNKAKPNGSYWLNDEATFSTIGEMNVRKLPGIGRVMENKLKELSVETCAELQTIPIDRLKTLFGSKIGQRLYENCRGNDSRTIQINKTRKSISVEINYGIRMTSEKQLKEFFKQISEELSSRLIKSDVVGKVLCLKIMVRHPDADRESVKYLGHGVCENFSKSAKLNGCTNNPSKISEISLELFRQLQKPLEELRGVGLTMSMLESINKKSNKKNITHYFKSNLIDGRTYNKPSEHLKNNISKPHDTNINIKSVKICKNSNIEQTKLSEAYEFKNIIELSDDENDNVAGKYDKIESYIIQLGKNDLDKLRNGVILWIQSKEDPQDDDRVLIERQIIRMVRKDIKFVKELLILIRLMLEELYSIDFDAAVNHKNISRTGYLWKKCYETLIENIQNDCLDLFGATIELDYNSDYVDNTGSEEQEQI